MLSFDPDRHQVAAVALVMPVKGLAIEGLSIEDLTGKRFWQDTEDDLAVFPSLSFFCFFLSLVGNRFNVTLLSASLLNMAACVEI